VESGLASRPRRLHDGAASSRFSIEDPMIDQQQLARHQADFKGFVNFMIAMIVVTVIVLVGMLIFLV
jgi:hypothetical protein